MAAPGRFATPFAPAFAEGPPLRLSSCLTASTSFVHSFVHEASAAAAACAGGLAGAAGFAAAALASGLADSADSDGGTPAPGWQRKCQSRMRSARHDAAQSRSAALPAASCRASTSAAAAEA